MSRQLFILGLLLAGGLAPADELIMKNGDRLTGTVVTRTGGTLSFKTSYAGTIAVQWDRIREVRSGQPMTLLLADDQAVTARVVKNAPETAVIEDEAGGAARTLKQSDVAAINPEPWRLGEGSKFSGRFNLAMKLERGNNDTDELDMDTKLQLRRKRDRLKFDMQLEIDNKNGKRTKHKWLALTTYDYFPERKWDYWLSAKQWYYGATLYLEQDKFADLNLRTGIGPHVGYQFFESKEMNLSSELGAAYIHENFQSEANNVYAAATWNINFDKYLFADITQFYHKQLGLYGLSESDKVVLKTWTGFRFPMLAGFVASAEANVEYDSEPAEEADSVDTTYRFKLGYQW